MDKIAVILSSYNGENYIYEQIVSLLNQQNVHVDIYIRDDGSTDNTLNILTKFDNITLYKGKNVGVTKSFFDLILKIPACYKYYAFCDQDDVWFPDKLYGSTKLVCSHDLPLLVCDSYVLTNEKLEVLKEKILSDSYTVENIYLEGLFLGCTMVFNNELFKIIRETLSNKLTWNVSFHDRWLSLLAVTYGQIIINKRPSMYYRQHTKNVVGGSRSIIQMSNKFFKNIKHSIYVYSFVDDLIILNEVNKNNNNYICNLSLSLLIMGDSSFNSRIKVIFSKKIKKTTIFKTILFKIRFFLSLYKTHNKELVL